jgi:hypothetical protein
LPRRQSGLAFTKARNSAFVTGLRISTKGLTATLPPAVLVLEHALELAAGMAT